MGCERSKISPVEDRAQQRVDRGPGTKHTVVLTDIQVDIITSTWPLLAEDLAGNGMSVFADIFESEPAVEKLFPYSKGSGNVADNPGFRAHSTRFMQTFADVCDALPNLDKESPISERLMVLGAQHAAMPGFDVVHFNIFVKCLHLTWERVLGEEYTDDVKDAWSGLFEFIMDRIRDGCTLYNQEDQPPNITK